METEACLLVVMRCLPAAGAESGNGNHSQSAKGDRGRRPPFRLLGAPSSSNAAESPQEGNSTESEDPWGFMAPLNSAMRSFVEMLKPIVSGSNGLERDFEDVLAAISETSRSPLFFFGLDSTPSQSTSSATAQPQNSGVVQRQDPTSGKVPQKKPQPSQPKEEGASKLPSRSALTSQTSSSGTPLGPGDASHKLLGKEHPPGHSDEDDDTANLWRTWDKEDLELM